MVNPRVDCAVVVEDHARDRRILRGLGYPELVTAIRKGAWRARVDGLWDVRRGKWLARLEIGQCHLFVVTVFRVRP